MPSSSGATDKLTGRSVWFLRSRLGCWDGCDRKPSCVRRARAIGWRAQRSTISRLPAITPAWGPPRSLSPENVTRAAPDASVWRAAGSVASHGGGPPASHGVAASRRPEPRSATTGTPSRDSSAAPTDSVKPVMR